MNPITSVQSLLRSFRKRRWRETPLWDWICATSAWAADRPQVTPETHTPNDYYGHAASIKEYVGLPPDTALHVSIPHGIRFDPGFWKFDFSPEHRIGLVPSVWRVQVLADRVQHELHAIGPLVHYTAPILTPAELQLCRERVGRVLLVFPAHSTHWVQSDYDLDVFSREIARAARSFDSVLICLYWKDVLRGLADAYQKRGYQCVTAGHMFDPLFIRRLRTLLEVSDATMSNQLGTHVGYSLHLGKPHHLAPSKLTITSKSKSRLNESTFDTREDQEKFADVFNNPQFKITTEQQELMEKYWGFSSVRDSQQLRALLESAAKIVNQAATRPVAQA